MKQATFYYNRAEGYSSKGKHTTARSFYDKSESLCEDALEILQEILHYDSKLRIWFDRDISFETGSDLSADIVSLPRLVTSRSNERLNEDSRIANKQDVKLSVVERVIEVVLREITSKLDDETYRKVSDAIMRLDILRRYVPTQELSVKFERQVADAIKNHNKDD